MELKAKVIELRSQRWSFPAIARHLDISVGIVWHIVNRDTV
ncbi:MAG: helix-turn-helix domain-containing protein [Anaerolineae bacterium]|nr:helix-turn-helix domain-containing protein [Anaerolineae bacterium]